MKSQVRPRRAFTFVGVTCSNPERKILSVWRLYIFLKKNCILQFPRESFKCCMKRKTFSFKFNMKWIQNNYYNKFTTVFFSLKVQRSRTIQILLEIKLPFPYRCLSDKLLFFIYISLSIPFAMSCIRTIINNRQEI